MADVDSIAESLVALAQPRAGEDNQQADAVTIPIKTTKGDEDQTMSLSPNGVADLFTLMIRDHHEQHHNRTRVNSMSASSTDSDLGEINNLNLKDVKYIGTYSPTARKRRIERFLEKRKRRVWAKKVDYGVRKNFADSRLRVKGRFVKKEDEELLVKLMAFT